MVFLNDEFWYEKIPYQYALYRKKTTVDKETGRKRRPSNLSDITTRWKVCSRQRPKSLLMTRSPVVK